MTATPKEDRRRLRLRALGGLVERSPTFTCGRFFIEISAAELALHLEALAREHEAAIDRLGDRNLPWLPLGAMRASDVAQRRALDYRFLLKHLVPGATYRVNADELEYLELVVPRTSIVRLLRQQLRAAG